VHVLAEADPGAVDAGECLDLLARVGRHHPGEGRRTPGGRERERHPDLPALDRDVVDVLQRDDGLVEFGVRDAVKPLADRPLGGPGPLWLGRHQSAAASAPP
jgi:hypothetical protein